MRFFFDHFLWGNIKKKYPVHFSLAPKKQESWRKLHALFSEQPRQRKVRVPKKRLQPGIIHILALYFEHTPPKNTKPRWRTNIAVASPFDDEVVVAAAMAMIHKINMLAAVGHGLLDSIDAEDSA